MIYRITVKYQGNTKAFYFDEKDFHAADFLATFWWRAEAFVAWMAYEKVTNS